MPVNPTDQPLTFHCTSCNGRIQTPASFAGFSAPCPFCAQIVTAPYPKPAQWVPAPATQRATIKRLTLPDHLSEPPLEAVQIAPRDIRPHPNHATSASPTTDPAVSKLDQLFNTIVAWRSESNLDHVFAAKARYPSNVRYGVPMTAICKRFDQDEARLEHT